MENAFLGAKIFFLRKYRMVILIKSGFGVHDREPAN